MTKDIITLKADFPIYGGLAIGRREGKVVMIKGAIPGETVEARIDLEKKDYAVASVVRVLDPSPDRVEPRSRYFGLCGGCQLQHVAYPHQVLLKEEVLKAVLKRTAGIEIELSEPLVGSPWNYRHKGRFKVSRGKTGFYKEKSREVVDVEHCALMSTEVNACYQKARGLLKGIDARGLDISCGDGGATLLIKAGLGARADWDAVAESFLKSVFSGVFIALGDKLFKYGEEYIPLDLAGLKYTVSPMSFFQANWELNQAAVKLVVERLEPLHGRTVLDLYSGAGNFALPISMRAGKVIAVEENPFAIEDGLRNLEINGIKNCEFIHSDVDSLDLAGPVDILIADPPRTGLTDGAAMKILALKPERVVYVSCDPATLARDLKKLSVQYAVESVRLVDFFPQTYHIEAVAFLSRK